VFENIANIGIGILWFVTVPLAIIVGAIFGFREEWRKHPTALARAKLTGGSLLGGVIVVMFVAYWVDQWDRKQAFMETCKAEYRAYYLKLYPGDTSGLRDYCENKFDE
jgi:hypothetical protein